MLRSFRYCPFELPYLEVGFTRLPTPSNWRTRASPSSHGQTGGDYSTKAGLFKRSGFEQAAVGRRPLLGKMVGSGGTFMRSIDAFGRRIASMRKVARGSIGALLL